MSEQINLEISNLIRARYPVIYVVSTEEARVLAALGEIAQSQGKSLVAWSFTKGFRILAGNRDDLREALEQRKTSDPITALQKVEEMALAGAGGMLVVFLDLPLAPPQVRRALRDLAGTLASSGGVTALILSPTLELPTGLEQEVVVVDYPLPDREELLAIIEECEAMLPDKVQVNLNGNRRKLTDALAGLTAREAENVLALAAVSTMRLDENALDFILKEKAAIIRKSGVLEFYAAKADWDDVGGLDLLVQWARESELAFTDEARKYGIEPPRGVLLAGIPGTGKSLAAKAIAGRGRPLLRLDFGALMSSLVGSSEANTRAALRVAEAVSPCVLWIDELEKGIGGAGGELDGGTTQRVLGTILTWMQECAKPVFVVATVNDVGRLPPELIRRFDQRFWVDLPAHIERQEIFAIHLRKRRRDPAAFDLSRLAALCEGYTGAEIEVAVKEALMAAFHDDQREAAIEDIEAALGNIRPISQGMGPRLVALREWGTNARPASSKTGKEPTKTRKRKIEV